MLANLEICKKIEFAGNIWVKDKYIFLASMIHIYSFIQDNISFWDNISDQLNLVNINGSDNGKRWSATSSVVKLRTKTIGSYIEFFDLFAQQLHGGWVA